MEFGTVVQFQSLNSNWYTGNSFERIWNVAWTFGNAILHGPFTGNNVARVRKDSAKSAIKIMLRTE